MATPGTDGPFSWVIAAACCWVTFVIQGLVRSSGVVYVALIDDYGANRAQASWPFTLRIAVWNLSGPVAGALSYRWSIRAITFTGVLIVTITNVACWFASDITTVTLILGGLQGLGVGMAVTLVPVIINQYFSRYKSTGAGIACAGATAGSFALPPIVEYAIEEYGLKGAFIMMGGITLHGVLGAALMRPASWLKKKDVSVINNGHPAKSNHCGDQNLNFLKSRSAEKLNEEEMKKLLKTPDKNGDKRNSKSVRFRRNDCEIIQTGEDESLTLIDSSLNKPITERSDSKKISIHDSSQMVKEKNPFINSQNSHPVPENSGHESDNERMRYGKLEFLDSEPHYDPQINLQLTNVPVVFKNSESHLPSACSNGDALVSPDECLKKPRNYTSDKNFQKQKSCSGVMEPIKTACHILKNPMFLIIASNYSVFFLSYMTYLIIIVDYSLDLGINRTDSVFLVSTFSIADLCGRLGSGWITDSGIVRRKNLMMGNMLVVGVLLAATSFTSSYIEITAVAVSCGLIVGINLILFYALLEEYLGLSQMPMAVGLMNFSIGIISLVTPLLTGYFRDIMGSYDHLFHFLGALTAFCGCLWIYEPLYSRRMKKKQLVKEVVGC